MIKTLTPDDIPRFIGKGGSGMRNNVIIPSWKMYDEHIKSKAIEEEKPKLFTPVFYIKKDFQHTKKYLNSKYF